MKQNEISVSCAPGLFTMLGVLFIGLKLTNYIDWSWWWVLLPLYGPVVLIATIGLGFLLFIAACWVLAVLFGKS